MCWAEEGVPGLEPSGETGPPSSGQVQSQTSEASGQQGVRLGRRPIATFAPIELRGLPNLDAAIEAGQARLKDEMNDR
jgi:hypothetical protein